MPKPIVLTDELRNQAIEEFIDYAKNVKMSDGKFSYNKNFTYKEDEKAKVLFTPIAFGKMVQLLMSFDSEVAWHGCGRKLTTNSYLIEDILVYPQTVTGTTVDMDEVEYSNWIYENREDERFDNIIMQGHSHVKMQTNPSGTDLSHQQEILSQMRNGKFYIFMIWNQRLEHNMKIYDLETNTLYENSEISYGIYEEECDIEEFINDAKEMVKKHTYQTTYQNQVYGQYGHSVGYNSYGGRVDVNQNNSYENDKKDKKKHTAGNGWHGRGSDSMVDAKKAGFKFDKFYN